MHECLDCGIWYSPASDEQSVDNSTYINILSEDSYLRVSEKRTLDFMAKDGIHKVLEIGAGFGILARQAKVNYPDIQYNILEDCKPLQEKLRGYGFHVFQNPADVPAEFFDLIVAHHVLEHFSDPSQFFKILHQSGDIGHRVCLAFPNRDNYLTRRGFYPDLNLPDHRFYYSISEVQKLASQYDYTVIQKDTIQEGRLIWDLHSAYYNRLRGSLELFKAVFPGLETELAEFKNDRATVEKIEKEIEELGLGTEAYLVLEKTNPVRL